jgi:hypothetical protein
MTSASASGIRWFTSFVLAGAAACAASPEPSGWPRILASVGLDFAATPPQFLLLEGDSPEARQFGFRATAETVHVASVEDVHDPELEIIWETPLTLPVFELPAGARIFAREKWTRAALVAGFRRENRAVLWTATSVGEKGYERFPYLLQALADLGVEFPFRGARSWAFFDSSYRLRADPAFLARRWRHAGIAAIHIASWHYYDADPARDAWLRGVIEACHRQAILVYAWLELPHVSEKFWDDHPQWREKTAILQDAHLDWRKLMNLADPDCARAIDAGLRALIGRFDWDGVNLAELYFESLYGAADPQRFTPMNATIRAEFEGQAGFDPIELFQRASPRYWERDTRAWTQFAQYRAALARRLQEHWLDRARRWRPDLDLALTHIDDRFDTRMKENLGADSAAALSLLEKFPFTFIVEDPATLWHLGPERYPDIARRYAALTAHPDRLAVDINIVERYQDVYPTKKQTGTELFQLAHLAAAAFPRVILYSERSIARADYDLLAAASAPVKRFERFGRGWLIDTPALIGVRFRGPARLDGKPWPATDGETAWVPAGRHVLEADATPAPLRLLASNADLLDARPLPRGLEFEYSSSSRAAVLLDTRPARIEVDGRDSNAPVLQADRGFSILLPPGKRKVRISAGQ